MIDYQQYIPETLRKGREQAFQKDLSRAYHEFYLINGQYCYRMTISQFQQKVWQASQICFIPKCIAEEEDPQQYFQLLYYIVIHSYALQKDKLKKVYAIFLFRRKIAVSPAYVENLAEFIKENKNEAKLDYIRIVPKLMGYFIYSTKQGIRTPLILAHEQNSKKKEKKKEKEIMQQKLTKSQYMKNFYFQIPDLESTWKFYQDLKRKERENSNSEFKLNLTDNYFPDRIKSILDNYQNELNLRNEK